MSEDTYLVWSNEHQGWWKPGGHGYSRGLRGAGHFTRANALRICRDAIPQAGHIGIIAEIPIKFADVTEFLAGAMIPTSIMEEP